MEIPTFRFTHIIFFDKVSYSREQKYYFTHFFYRPLLACFLNLNQCAKCICESIIT